MEIMIPYTQYIFLCLLLHVNCNILIEKLAIVKRNREDRMETLCQYLIISSII